MNLTKDYQITSIHPVSINHLTHMVLCLSVVIFLSVCYKLLVNSAVLVSMMKVRCSFLKSNPALTQSAALKKNCSKTEACLQLLWGCRANELMGCISMLDQTSTDVSIRVAWRKKLCRHNPAARYYYGSMQQYLYFNTKSPLQLCHRARTQICLHPTDGRFNLSSFYLHMDSSYL